MGVFDGTVMLLALWLYGEWECDCADQGVVSCSLLGLRLTCAFCMRVRALCVGMWGLCVYLAVVPCGRVCSRGLRRQLCASGSNGFFWLAQCVALAGVVLVASLMKPRHRLCAA